MKSPSVLRPVAKLIGPAAIIAQIAEILIAEKIEGGELFTDEELKILLEVSQQKQEGEEEASDSETTQPAQLDDEGEQ